jgi:hypothetical protein
MIYFQVKNILKNNGYHKTKRARMLTLCRGGRPHFFNKKLCSSSTSVFFYKKKSVTQVINLTRSNKLILF